MLLCSWVVLIAVNQPFFAGSAGFPNKQQQKSSHALPHYCLQACAGPKVAELELPLAELPPPSAPSTRDCTPSRQRVSSLLPSTPQTAPPAAGSMAQQMLSPPPKRLATAVRAPAASELMSPPPTRTRAGNRRLVMDVDKAAAGEKGQRDRYITPPSLCCDNA